MLDTNIKLLLPQTVQDALQGMYELHKTPDEQVIPLIMSIANFATQGLYDIDAVSWDRSVMSLYTVILNKSGGRKSTTLNEVMRGIKDFERDEKKRYASEISVYTIEHEKWKKDFKKAVEDKATLPKEPSRPIGAIYMREKATTNGLLNAVVSVPFCGLINPDAAEFFNSHAFQDSKSGKDTEMVTTLSKLFSGERVSRQTGVKEDELQVEHRRFMMLAMLQEEMAEFITNEKYRDQGFIPRLLISSVPEYDSGYISLARTDDGKKASARKLIDKFNDRVYELLTRVTPSSNKIKQQSSKRNVMSNLNHAADDLCELTLDVLPIDDSARPLLEKFSNESTRLSKEISHSHYASFMVRRYELAIRIAATFAVFEGDNAINERWAVVGIAFMEWFTEQRLALTNNTNQGKKSVIEIGHTLVDWMRRKGLTSITNTEAVQKGPTSYRNTVSAERKLVLEELMSRELVKVAVDAKSQKVTIVLTDVGDSSQV